MKRALVFISPLAITLLANSIASGWPRDLETISGTPAITQDVLYAGQSLTTSTGACFRLNMQSDGNLVTYNQYNHPLWSTNTVGRGFYAVLQVDGNFVVYNTSDAAVWATNTLNHDYPFTRWLVQQNDGNLVLYKGIGNAQFQAVWASGVVVHDVQNPCTTNGVKTRTYSNVKCTGNEYKTLYLDQPRQSWCGSFCANDSSCKSYYYIPPGIEDSTRGVCHLRNSASVSLQSVPLAQCGVKTAQDDGNLP